MKKITIVLYLIVPISLLLSCNKYQESAIPQETEWIMFSTGDGIEGSGYVETRALGNEITCDITDWEEEDSNETRAGIVETLYDSVGVFGYNYKHWSSSELPGVMCNTLNVLKANKLATETKILWKDFTKDSLRFYAYAPYGVGTVSTAAEGGVPYLKYTVPSSVTTQMDILYAQSEAVPNTNRDAVPLEFKHAMTAVQFRLGMDDATLTSVQITKIKNQGKLSLDGTWSELDGNETFTITDQNSVLLMIPQTLSYGSSATDSAMVTLKYQDGTGDHTISASIGKTEWPAGKRVVYTLKKKPGEGTVEYIYFDFTAGDIILTNKNYTGYVFVKGVAKEVSGEHKDSNKYYIYQSAPDDSTSNDKIKSSKTGYTSSADFGTKNPILPEYSEIKVGGKSWGEYITNNTDPAAVLATWNNKSICPENFLEPTPRRILISGDSKFDVTLDRVYSRYYPYRGSKTGDIYEGVVTTAPYGSGDGRQYKDVYGGITIGQSSLTVNNNYPVYSSASDAPNWDRSYKEKVTLRLKGNNYFSRIEYARKISLDPMEGYLKITSEKGDGIAEGTLTVTLPYLRKAHPTDDGLWNFVRCALIGGGANDKNATTNLLLRQVRDLYFNGGIVYCGVEKIRNSNWKTNENMIPPIGTNNAQAQITIEGGIVTAVSNGTGPAIGGGAGWVKSGGNGIVTINGGTVYAYSFGVFNAESSVKAPVMSAAIGGGSSGNVKGASGTVNINGGTVHAYSVGGCAIGGGTSATDVGGDGTVTIEGGNIFANSVSGKIGADYTATAGVAIGGGRSGITKGNGGDATVTITGGKIVAGSVGGGKCGNDKGKLGRAVVDVSGGETSAQFLLVKDKSVSTANTFTMSDGTIKNSNTSDTEYVKVQENGGAVYMESGKCTIRGGTISNCSAKNGGAVYMNGGTFRMVKGNIRDCKGLTSGGGVYIKGGNVEIDSTGTISHNMAASGNGGGVFIEGGDFEMKGGSVSNNTSNHNIATGLEGNGGGIYVASDTSNVNVTITGGTIKKNFSDRSGAGLRVDMTGAAKGIAANIVIGTPGGVASTPDISENTASFTGGGMSVAGIGSKITIYSGTVKGNVSSIVTNEEIENDGGIVDLVGKNTPGQPQQVNVNYKTIYFYANNGDDPEPSDEQRVITSTNSPLKPTEKALNFTKEFYHLDSWNTKRDGSGVTYAKEGGEDCKMNLTSDLVLYGQWVRNQ